jgi:predicted amidophosphoribosyltransferase
MASNILDLNPGLPSLPIIGPSLCALCSSHDTTTERTLCAACQEQILQFVGDYSADLKVSIWHCPRCTLINKINNERCDACGHSKLESVGFYFI